MDIGQDVTEFVGYGSRLFRRLRREGGALSAVDLHILIVQLNILELETANPQILRKMQDSEAAEGLLLLNNPQTFQHICLAHRPINTCNYL